MRDQAAPGRDAAIHAGHAARIPRLLPRLRSGGEVSLFPVAAHVRSGLRQRAVRAELSARRATVPDRAAGRAAPAVRSGAEGSQGGQCDAGTEGGSSGPAAGACDRPRRHRATRRGVSGGRGPLRPDCRRRRQGAVDILPHSRSARPRRPQGNPRSAGRLRLCDAQGGRAGRQGRQLRARGGWRQPDCAREQPAARDRPDAQGRAVCGRETGASRRCAVADEWLGRPRSHSRVRRAEERVATDAARSMAPAARPVLGAGHVGRGLGRGLPPLPAVARSRGHARRAFRSDLGDAGRARHVARLRDRRRPPPAAAGRAGVPGRRYSRFRPMAQATRLRTSSPATRGTPPPIRR